VSFTWWRYPSRRFTADGQPFEVRMKARGSEVLSELWTGGVLVAEGRKPVVGPEAVENHRLVARLSDGRLLDVEVGYVSSWTTGVAARIEGQLIYESHPGREIAYPEQYRQQIVEMKGGVGGAWREGVDASGTDFQALRRNKVPIIVDIATGLLFFVVAKLTDLTTAALVGAAVGIALIVAQRFVKVDLLGGLALFGIVMMLISAGLALAFQDEDMIKMRGTIMGLLGAILFLGDGLLGGNRLGKGLARYMPYGDIDPGRLAVGMGLLGLLMAVLNFAVARLASTDVWLLYSTFFDFFLIMLLATLVVRFARGKRFTREADARA